MGGLLAPAVCTSEASELHGNSFNSSSSVGPSTLFVAIWAVRGLRTKIAAPLLTPYVISRVGPAEHRTPTICYSMEQTWHEDNIGSFRLDDDCLSLELEVMNAQVAEDSRLGQVVLQLRDLCRLAPGQWHQRKERLQGEHHGVLEFALHLEPSPKAELSESWSAADDSQLRGHGTLVSSPCT